MRLLISGHHNEGKGKERVPFINLADHLCPSFSGDKWSLLLNYGRMRRVFLSSIKFSFPFILIIFK